MPSPVTGNGEAVDFLYNHLNQMPSFKRALHYALHNKNQFLDSCIKYLGFCIPDKAYISLRYRLCMGEWINWKDPKTFNEKLQWLKLYNRKPEYTAMVDKFAVKSIVSSKIGGDYVVPTLGVWDNPDLIDWDSLPSQFVLKTTHGAGGCGVVVCKDKDSFDREAAVSKLWTSYKSNPYQSYREWPYKNVKKQIIAEKYIVDSEGHLNDYKFYCFNGKVKLLMMASNRFSKDARFDFYDENGIRQDITSIHPQSNENPVLPGSFWKMKDVAEILSEGIPHVRVDLYDVDGHIYFGELTFFDSSGMDRLSPDEWNYRLGSWLDIKTIS